MDALETYGWYFVGLMAILTLLACADITLDHLEIEKQERIERETDCESRTIYEGIPNRSGGRAEPNDKGHLQAYPDED